MKSRVLAAMATVALVVLLGAQGASAEECAQPDPSVRRTPVVRAIEEVQGAVVNVGTTKVVLLRDPFFDQFVAPRRAETFSLGSGMIIGEEGYIVTNYHVVARASKIVVKLLDGTNLPARIVGADPDDDMAVIKVDREEPFPTVKLGTTADLMTGETAIAVGNPFGFANTVTVGVVSAKGRAVYGPEDLVLEDLIQTSAPINPGNSGGPLLNICGQVIGMNTVVRSNAQGIGFAISVDRMKSAIGQMVELRTLKGIWFGARVADHYEAESEAEILRFAGIIVEDIDEGSPAERAGLRKGDLIETVEGSPVPSAIEFQLALLEYDAGTPVSLRGTRAQQPLAARVVLSEAPEHPVVALARTRLGITRVRELSQAMANRLGIRRDIGVLVDKLDAGQRVYQEGVREGDIIVGMGKQQIKSLDDLASALKGLSSNARVRIAFYRLQNDQLFYVDLNVK